MSALLQHHSPAWNWSLPIHSKPSVKILLPLMGEGIPPLKSLACWSPRSQASSWRTTVCGQTAGSPVGHPESPGRMARGSRVSGPQLSPSPRSRLYLTVHLLWAIWSCHKKMFQKHPPNQQRGGTCCVKSGRFPSAPGPAQERLPAKPPGTRAGCTPLYVYLLLLIYPTQTNWHPLTHHIAFSTGDLCTRPPARPGLHVRGAQCREWSPYTQPFPLGPVCSQESGPEAEAKYHCLLLPNSERFLGITSAASSTAPGCSSLEEKSIFQATRLAFSRRCKRIPCFLQLCSPWDQRLGFWMNWLQELTGNRAHPYFIRGRTVGN